MRVALLYPPPWKIPLQGHVPALDGDGPPVEYMPGDLDGDFFQIPYGLLTLGSEAIRAGHDVKVLNLSGFAWSHVERLIASLDADVWGLSCWTANRRGVALVAQEIKRHHPRAHVVVGGPHATPLAREMLERVSAIDTVCVGESERTFLELLERVAVGGSLDGLSGAFVRLRGSIVQGPPRSAIERIDDLESPQKHFATHILMTSRGCPWACTFCGAETSWGRGFRGHSVEYTIRAIENALSRLPVRMLQIKDDTFTTQRKRVLELCAEIRRRDIKFVWSCDTRVDVISDDLLREMRLAGCERLSLGVESGSQSVLDAMDKKITPDEILASTRLAKKWGIRVRYYMIVGARGETARSLRETEDFLARAAPHQYVFACLSIYPGTKDFDDALAQGVLTADTYFDGDFQEFKYPLDATPEDAALFGEWFSKNKGLRTQHRPSVDELRGVLERLGDHWAAHLDLAGALFHAGDLDGAERHAQRALELGHPTPGLCHNYLACVSARRGDLSSAKNRFDAAIAADPQHGVLLANVVALDDWSAAGGGDLAALPLQASHEFQLLERTLQPTLPGPLPADVAVWRPRTPPTRIAPIRPQEIIADRKRRGLDVIRS